VKVVDKLGVAVVSSLHEQDCINYPRFKEHSALGRILSHTDPVRKYQKHE
jgi:hypothetical protein